MGASLDKSLLRGLTVAQLKERAEQAQRDQRVAALQAMELLKRADQLGAEATQYMTLALITERANGRPISSTGLRAGHSPDGDGRRGLLTPFKADIRKPL